MKQTGQTDPRAEDTMYFRKMYRRALESREITTIFRPGDRTRIGHGKGYRPGEIVEIKLLDKVGADWANLAPKLVDGFGILAEIVETEAVTISALKPKDFKGSSEDVRDAKTLRYHLALIYNIDDRELTDDALITRTTFKYLD